MNLLILLKFTQITPVENKNYTGGWLEEEWLAFFSGRQNEGLLSRV